MAEAIFLWACGLMLAVLMLFTLNVARDTGRFPEEFTRPKAPPERARWN